MKTNIEEMLEKFKINAAISNFKEDYENEAKRKINSNKNDNVFIRKYIMKKRIVATACASFVLISGVVFATHIEEIARIF